MELVSRFFGRRSRQRGGRELSRLQVASREQARRELVVMALSDTLRRHRLPAGCITADGLPGSAADGQRGLHLQLVFRDWQPRLLPHVVALETAVTARLARLDPLSPSWIAGISWRFEPAERALWPQLPAVGLLEAGSVRPGAAAGGHTMAAFDRLLEPREEHFLERAPANRDFSPTLPMYGG
jgi:hypothetical protein